ncbi:YeiH family protein [Bacillus massiliigorillae]|uniref:YeiH family protein n=1 Tax=Bacillus massiliigorillae TaxID=1243664 RepID=UPI0003A08AD4|nr:putative sulfate exporter family transporter [Bacillus massiliigorillae]
MRSSTQNQAVGFLLGIGLTLLIALLAGQITKLPFFSIMGMMIVSILIGMAWNAVWKVPLSISGGVKFSSRYLLRAGIILMGLRLNLQQIIDAGFPVLITDIVVIIGTLVGMYYIGKLLKVDQHLNILLSVGTAVCGAAAVVAIASVIKSRQQETAIAVAWVAILGTIASLFYIFLFPILELHPYNYGVLVGATLHEIAHVVASTIPGGTESDTIGIVVKLGRVALLIPVALIIGSLFGPKTDSTKKRSLKDLPIPWFIFGFLAMSVVNTINIFPQSFTDAFIPISSYLLAMAMAGLGLGINIADFKASGIKPAIQGVLGTVLVCGIGVLMLLFFF